jgi:hypothetical protein
VTGIALLAPLFALFEIWQLVMAERYLGIKQIARGGDPREMGPSEPVAFLWTASIALYALWAAALLIPKETRVFGVGMIATTAVAYPIRRNAKLKMILVVITFEGAIRLVFVAGLAIMAVRRLL